MEKKYVGQVELDQIEQWKKQHGTIFSYIVDGKICYLKTVSREEYARASSKIASAPAKFTEQLVTDCWLGGCEEIKDTDKYYFGLVEQVERLLNKKVGELGEL